jgi:signal transduction histidine kinase
VLYGLLYVLYISPVQMRRPPALTIVTVGLLILLPALALLQYRWVGQVSAAERDRMERNLRISSFQFQRAFDDEITRTVNGLRMNVATVGDSAWNRYADRYATWSATAEHPRLLANIYLVDVEQGQLRLRRWNAAAESFDAAEWPAILTPWRPLFEQAYAAYMKREPMARAPLPDEDSLLISPLLFGRGQGGPQLPGPPAPGAPAPPDPALFGFTVLQLDTDYIRTQMLPMLTERHFTNTEGDRYRVAIVDVSNTNAVIYRTDPEAPVDSAHAAEAESLFGAFRDPFAFLRGGFGGGNFGGGRGGPNGGGGRGGGRGAPRIDDDDSNGPRFNPDAGRWALFVQHERGSLDAAVGAIRRRNLGISFGVLLLLSGSVLLLTVSSRRAQRLAQQQIEFVAGVSHELRTPVAVIRSAAENLSQGVVGSGDRVKRYGQMIESESRRLGEMIERVLQYAGIASGLGVTARVPVAPALLIDEAIASAGPAILGANVQPSIPDHLPDVLGDQAALRSAVHNLIVNAVKYGGADGWVGVRAEASGRGRRAEVRITVEDHGAGIPHDELPHIFEPFYRGADALSKQIHGNGLGLSLVQQIVAAHGGRVTVSSRAGTGSAFTIHLPAAPADGRAADADAAAVQVTQPAVHS